MVKKHTVTHGRARKVRCIKDPYKIFDANFTTKDMLNACHTNSRLFNIMLSHTAFTEHESCEFIMSYFGSFGEQSLQNVAMFCDKYCIDLYIHNHLICIQPRAIVGTFDDEDCMVCCENSNVKTGCNHYVCIRCMQGCQMKCPYCRKYILHYTEKVE